jgi:TonB family protein
VRTFTGRISNGLWPSFGQAACRIVAALVGMGLTVPLAAAPVPLKPTSKWNVDFGDAHCIAMRNYGTEAAPLMLALKPSPIGDVMQVSVVRQSAKPETDQYSGSMTIDAAAPVRVSVLGYHGKGNTSRVASINLPIDKYQPLRSASRVRLQSAGEIDASFVLSDMAPVARALDRCVAGLKELWHIGAGDAVIATPAMSTKPLFTHFGPDDYPAVAVMKGDSGLVAITTLIDETGKIASCMVTQTSGYASLDAQSCAMITTRAKFVAATGPDGKPVKSVLESRIRWVTHN